MSLDGSVRWPVHWLETVDSTNEEAKRRAMASGFADQWICAHEQASGRGRLGRRWISPKGNLYATALFGWSGPMAALTRIPFAAALAVADTVAMLAPEADEPPRLKWPNDVRCGGAKVSGILVETGMTGDERWVAAGIGVNVGFVPDGVDQAGTSLADLRGDRLVTVEVAHDALQGAFALRMHEAVTDFAPTRRAWLERAEGLGQTVRVKLDGAVLEGVFEDMAPDGGLLLHLPDGTRETIRAGDVELIREVGAE